MADVKTKEEIAQDYTAMGHSVDLINAIIAGTQMADESAEDKQDCVDTIRNASILQTPTSPKLWKEQDTRRLDIGERRFADL